MKIPQHLYRLLYLILLSCFCSTVFSAQEFVIHDIRVEGLQRLTPGTVFNYMPIEVGDTFNDQISIEAVRSLFKTGFFDDVRLERDGNVLVVLVKERPAISSILIEGNKDIKTEDLLDGLKEVGFAEGRVFDQSQLEMLERELRRQYFSAGKYGVRITSTLQPLDNNRVAVSIDVSEGKAAKIKQINIIGNRTFKEKKLLKTFELTGKTLLSFFTKTDQYSRQKLSADLETLRSYYLDSGYVNFNIDSTQVSITPDKKDIYITINITEGAQYTISGVKLAGELILPEEKLFDYIIVKEGSLFSRRDVTNSSTFLTDVLGNEGYAFTNVNSIPDIDEDNKTVSITFFVDPGKRVYVRRVNFSGNTRTRDDVIRRELRQQEGAWISTPNVERGKIRMQRLGYFKEVNVETPAVANSADQVDVEYTVEEKPFGNFLAGVGFSQTQGIILQTSITQDNFLGSGKRIQFAFNNSKVNRRLSLGYMNPYYTVDGISRGFNLNYQETSAFDANVTAFDSRVFGGGVSFGIPVTEYNFLSVAFNYENTQLSRASSQFANQVGVFIEEQGRKFDIFRISAGFAYDTRNKTILPERGQLHQISAELAVPFVGNSLEFYKVNYRTQYFRPLFGDFIFALKGDIGYGDGYGDLDTLPFFENYYAGGPRSVRGYEENTLGPLDNFRRPLGGNIKVIAGAEVIIPVPFLKDFDQVRMAAFFDAGNVWCSGKNNISVVSLGQVVESCPDSARFGFDNLRYAAGVSGIWVSPFGLVSVSVAKPIGDKPGDQVQQFQFTFGNSF
jgi:outer membrane protein insertion porin family